MRGRKANHLIRFFLFGLGSAALHLALYSSLILVAPKETHGPGRFRTRPVMVELIEAERVEPKEARQRLRELEKNQSFVSDVEVPPEKLAKAKKEDDEARFKSFMRRRVQEETRAQRTGPSQNEAPQRNAAQTPNRPLDQANISPGLLVENRELRRNSIQFSPLAGLSRMMANESRTAEKLPPEIRVADMTALNTDGTLYYSFYQRGREATYWRWTNLVRAALSQDRLDTSRLGVDRELTTVYEMQLDAKGQFVRGRLLQSSGHQRLDEAALFAFAQARAFPNPPAEMVDPDGLIRWVWSFTVEANPMVAGP